MLSRRDFLKRMGAGTAIAAAPGLALAAADTDARLVLVILRGAVDGLALAAPYGDRHYRGVRGELALPEPGASDGVLDLDGYFGLHPRLRHLHGFFRAGDASIVHAVASPYRERSHFDGQDVLETGGIEVGASRTGWLNRALVPLGGKDTGEVAIALAQNTPFVLRGPQSVMSWAPSRLADPDTDLIERLRLIYASDEFFAARLEQAIESQRIADGAGSMASRRARGNEQLTGNLETAAKFLNAEDGPRIAVVEANGWDTHANQGAASGALANQFGALDEGLARLRKTLDDTWQRTAVLVVTEFGRTVRVNGTRGTDHGTASAAIVAGGAVKGKQIVTHWPGIGSGDLFDDRDLAPTLDIRSVFKAVLIEHLGLDGGFVERDVFPDSRAARPLGMLI